ncbi:hypothetical protein JCM21900_003790 [Sporobolomyces salmonicolor]
MDALTKQMENVCKATEGGNRANAGTSLGIVRKSIVRKRQRSELGGIEGHAAKRKDSVGGADQGERPVLKRRRTLPIHSQPSQQRSKSYDTQLNQPVDEDLASPLQFVRVLSPSGAGAMRTKVEAKRAPRRHGGCQRSSPLELPFWMRGEQSSPYLKGKKRYAESLGQEAAHFFDSKSPFLPPFINPTHDVFGPTLSRPSAGVAASAFPKRAVSVEPPLQQVEYCAPYQDQNVPPLPLESSVWGVSPLPRPQPGPFAAATPPPRHDLDPKVLLQTPPPPFNHPASRVANVHHKVLVPDSPPPPPLQPSAKQPGPKGISSSSREKPALPERKVDAGEERPGKGWDSVAQAGQLASFLVQAAQDMESCGKAEEARQAFEIFRDQAEEEDPIEAA